MKREAQTSSVRFLDEICLNGKHAIENNLGEEEDTNSDGRRLDGMKCGADQELLTEVGWRLEWQFKIWIEDPWFFNNARRKHLLYQQESTSMC